MCVHDLHYTVDFSLQVDDDHHQYVAVPLPSTSLLFLEKVIKLYRNIFSRLVILKLLILVWNDVHYCLKFVNLFINRSVLKKFFSNHAFFQRLKKLVKTSRETISAPCWNDYFSTVLKWFSFFMIFSRVFLSNLQTQKSNDITVCSRRPTDFFRLVPVP